MAQSSLYQSDYRILLSSISLEEVNQNLRFLHGVSHQGKVTSGCTTFGWFLASCVSSPVRFRDSLIVNQYLWTQSIEVLVFLHVDGHQRKLVSQDYHFYWVWLGVPLI